ncbi:DUF4267 domain-containing protein [Shimazuella alba]|uniref:DUF4267 domain-containing protein n=1 Tax=Shimazuella alba TaxID=2690964 RepID=A0A6I4VT23_9BACL|nr:DUF4267 domain-containing protein [Shimazuella alba]MXQ52970.1 DUF4267 domain-containing protein [Shimazuella alba]
MNNTYWGPKSVTFWLVGVVTLLMLYIGVNGFLQPEAAIQGFGLPLQDAADKSIVWIKADRDLFIGVFLLALMVLRMRKASMVFLLSATGMPVVDAILVLQNAADKTPSWIHITTVVYMLIVSWMLYQQEKKANIS